MLVGSHVLLGAASWIAAAPALGTRIDGVGLICALVGALLPDIDHPKSWVGRRLWLISRLISSVFGHRGFTHSLFAVVLGGMAVLAQGADGRWLMPVVVGYLSHLAADLVSGGIPLLWPLRRNVAIRLCRTGSWSEIVVTAVCLALLLQAQASVLPLRLL